MATETRDRKADQWCDKKNWWIVQFTFYNMLNYKSLRQIIVIPSDLTLPLLFLFLSIVIFHLPSFSVYHQNWRSWNGEETREYCSCAVKFFTGSKMSWNPECCERYSCCGNCKAVLKAVTILHFHPFSLPPPPPPAPLTYPGVGEGQLHILVLTQLPPLFLLSVPASRFF